MLRMPNKTACTATRENLIEQIIGASEAKGKKKKSKPIFTKTSYARTPCQRIFQPILVLDISLTKPADKWYKVFMKVNF